MGARCSRFGLCWWPSNLKSNGPHSTNLVLNLVIVKKVENDLPGLTVVEKPRTRGPKRASKIRKLFDLSKDDDIRKYVNTYRRSFTNKKG